LPVAPSLQDPARWQTFSLTHGIRTTDRLQRTARCESASACRRWGHLALMKIPPERSRRTHQLALTMPGMSPLKASSHRSCCGRGHKDAEGATAPAGQRTNEIGWRVGSAFRGFPAVPAHRALWVRVAGRRSAATAFASAAYFFAYL
jgi:hypothetical protein